MISKCEYTCEVCRKTSDNPGEIHACEEQGRQTPKFSIGISVQFRPFTQQEQWLPGEVAEIGIAEGTHVAMYTFNVSPEVARALGQQNDSGRLGSYPEDRVKLAA